MSGHDVFELVRLVAVLALVVAAAAIATPKGRLPLALRGVLAVLRKDAGMTGTQGMAGTVPGWKRLVAFALVLLAVLLAVVPVAKPVLPVLSRADRQEDSRPQLPLRAAAVR